MKRSWVYYFNPLYQRNNVKKVHGFVGSNDIIEASPTSNFLQSKINCFLTRTNFTNPVESFITIISYQHKEFCHLLGVLLHTVPIPLSIACLLHSILPPLNLLFWCFQHPQNLLHPFGIFSWLSFCIFSTFWRHFYTL